MKIFVQRLLEKNKFYYNHKFEKLLIIITLFFIIFNNGYLSKYNKSKDLKKSKNISPIKVGLCIICKTENLYIKEFIEHYKYLGYNHIFIYDNNDLNGEKLEDIIKTDIEEGFISIINYRGDKNKPIFRAYIDCYERNNKYFDWISFFDIDEFLEIKPKNIKIQEFLGNEKYKNCQNIKFNWLLYSDGDKIYYENKSIQERFKTALYNNTLNSHIKSTVRGKLPTNYWKGTNNPHSGRNSYNCCNPSGIQISKNSMFNVPFDYKYGFLKHYRTKTIEEYINKMRKGKPDTKMDYKYMVRMFFLTNKKTKEKLNIFRKTFNINYYI